MTPRHRLAGRCRGSLALAAALALLASTAAAQRGPHAQLAYGDLLGEVERGTVTDVYIEGNRISGHFNDGRPFSAAAPNDPRMVDRFVDRGVRVSAAPSEDAPYLGWVIGGVLVVLAWWFIARPLRAAVVLLREINARLAGGPPRAG